MPPRVIVIIPAFNEEASLAGVVADLRANAPETSILVVDDGSTDNTAAVARSLGVPVLPLPFNLGVGGALRTGFRYAVRHGFDRAVQFDGDGQHDATQIAILMRALDDGADLVIGTRFGEGTDYDVGRTRSGAMRLLRIGVRLLSGQAFTDTSSGFRAFSGRMLGYFAETYPREYLADTVEALLLASYEGYRLAEVPVVMRQRTAGTASNRSFKLAYNYLRLFVVMVTTMPLRRRPRVAS